jgi:hypothetical protein
MTRLSAAARQATFRILDTSENKRGVLQLVGDAACEVHSGLLLQRNAANRGGELLPVATVY